MWAPPKAAAARVEASDRHVHAGPAVHQAGSTAAQHQIAIRGILCLIGGDLRILERRTGSNRQHH